MTPADREAVTHLVGAEYDEALCGNQPQDGDSMTIDDHLVTCPACLKTRDSLWPAPRLEEIK